MGKAERTWLYIMIGVAAFGFIGGVQSDAEGSQWLGFLLGCGIVYLVGRGIISNFKKS